MLTRRTLMQTGLVAGASLFSRLGFAQSMPALDRARRFVFFYLPGGWDQLLFLDPREEQGDIARTDVDPAYASFGAPLGGGPHFTGRVYRPYATSRDFMLGPGVVATTGPGTDLPVAGPTLVSLASAGVPMAIVRGLNMGTLGHEPGQAYFLTAAPAQGSAAVGASIPIRIAALLEDPATAAQTLTPVLSFGLQSYTGDKPGRLAAFSVGSLDDVQRLLARQSGLVLSPSTEASLGRWKGRALEKSRGLSRQLLQSYEGAAEMIEAKVADRFDLLRGTSPALQAVRARYGLSAQSNPGSAEAVAAFAAQAVKESLAQFISVSMPVGLDSHGGDNRAHAQAAWPALRALSLFLDDLRSAPSALGGTWLEHTTVLVFSEFARTPRFNVAGGRDHHFTNSCLLAGAGVRAGAVVGGSSVVGMQPLPWDFEGARTLPADTPLTATRRHLVPEDIAATLMASAGAPWNELRTARPLWPALTRAP
ncbi:MAG: DUF1501 domain-containing protein [Myxococcaceae bacterium]|nr:DUF1501 domain-containing protein [Myxococcaceae bacterium]